jgi:hypothetical protein
MSSAIFHLTNIDNYPNRYAIEQGITFDWLTIVIEGDFTRWTPRGQIRDRYAEEGGIVKATFSFAPLILGSAALSTGGNATGTIVKPFLSQAQTKVLNWLAAKMKVRTSEREQAIPGRNIWVYDLELESPEGNVLRILEGWVEVSPEVTR